MDNDTMKELSILGGGYTVLSPFGIRMCADGVKRWHQGIDLACEIGTPVLSPIPAIVANVYEDGYFNRGTVVVLRDILTDDRYAFCYLSEVLVEIGDSIAVGRVFARTGDGGASGVPHLHFERATGCRWQFGQVTRMTPVDPRDKLTITIPE